MHPASGFFWHDALVDSLAGGARLISAAEQPRGNRGAAFAFTAGNGRVGSGFYGDLRGDSEGLVRLAREFDQRSSVFTASDGCVVAHQAGARESELRSFEFRVSSFEFRVSRVKTRRDIQR